MSGCGYSRALARFTACVAPKKVKSLDQGSVTFHAQTPSLDPFRNPEDNVDEQSDDQDENWFGSTDVGENNDLKLEEDVNNWELDDDDDDDHPPPPIVSHIDISGNSPLPDFSAPNQPSLFQDLEENEEEEQKVRGRRDLFDPIAESFAGGIQNKAIFCGLNPRNKPINAVWGNRLQCLHKGWAAGKKFVHK